MGDESMIDNDVIALLEALSSGDERRLRHDANQLLETN